MALTKADEPGTFVVAQTRGDEPGTFVVAQTRGDESHFVSSPAHHSGTCADVTA